MYTMKLELVEVDYDEERNQCDRCFFNTNWITMPCPKLEDNYTLLCDSSVCDKHFIVRLVPDEKES